MTEFVIIDFMDDSYNSSAFYICDAKNSAHFFKSYTKLQATIKKKSVTETTPNEVPKEKLLFDHLKICVPKDNQKANVTDAMHKKIPNRNEQNINCIPKNLDNEINKTYKNSTKITNIAKLKVPKIKHCKPKKKLIKRKRPIPTKGLSEILSKRINETNLNFKIINSANS